MKPEIESYVCLTSCSNRGISNRRGNRQKPTQTKPSRKNLL